MANDTPITRQNGGRTEVFDPVRRRYVALTPEEWVRQQTIILLHQRFGYPLELMQVEGELRVNGLIRRCDIVVYGRRVKPLMIVECKNDTVPLTQRVVDQACRYNTELQVPFLLLTNGRQMLCLKVDFLHGTLQQTELPQWTLLNSVP